MISRLRPLLNVEGSFVYNNPRVTLRDYVWVCVLSYGQGTSSVGSMTRWSADVFLCPKAAAIC